MNYRRLGRSALRVSALCLGTMNFGPRTSPADSFAILNAALEAGVNFVDTADQYGGHLGVGTTEAILGDWLAEDPARRDRIVLATKVHEPMSDDINDRGLSARHIQMACDASLKRLKTDHIDLYQMHHIDRAAPIEEIWQAMDRLISQGKITYVGSSNFPGWTIARANEKAIARGRLGLVSEQSLYNLVERRAELEVIPAALEYGLGVITWSPLAGGLLAGGATDGDGRRQAEGLQRAARDRADQLGRYEALCRDLGQSPSAVALAWLLHQPGVAATIIGPRTLDQLTSVLQVPDLVLSPETLAALDAIFPPCGPAPEAYAW
ncbi:aldo/keto reductase [Phenylobacterium aquaticum]|uniref:aldo/keto reductase n=1 Tax=Phenylobacterium aquaticum TaxID=1763816 RepID=UPI001F5CD2ED|nr:aldo/keto reductase [Phenylobacterium aquaticum]MCI3131991.1 aldo/keto reductase [Phenylobacterium aquaticum]